MTVVTRMRFPKNSYHDHHEAIEILNQLTLCTTDLYLDLLPLKDSNQKNKRKLDRMKQSSMHQRKKKKIRNSITIEIPLDEIEIKL